MPDNFSRAFDLTIGYEGGYTANPDDPGNWTGGAVNLGTLKGTKFGISAAAFPNLDILNLTRAQAEGIYRNRYWTPAGCDSLPWPLCAVVFDAAVNNGLGRVTPWLTPAVKAAQAAAGLAADGVVGPLTQAAFQRPEVVRAAAQEFVAQRMAFMGSLATWRTFGLGWARRLVAQAALAGTTSV